MTTATAMPSVLGPPSTAAGVNPFALAADIFDPPKWEAEGRPALEPHQTPPDGLPGRDWQLWLLEAGRGSGKTEGAARYFTEYMRQHPGSRGRIIAPTFGDAVEACVEGPSGLRSVDPDGVTFRPSAPGGAKVTWRNGSEALVLGTHTGKDVERLRAAGNRHLDWWEEMAANTQLADAWDQAAFGLRLGDYPHSIASSTPRNTTAYKAIRKLALETKSLKTGSLFDNPHLPQSYRDQLIKRYEGTRLGRQELYGELLTDVEGALWTMAQIEAGRVTPEQVPDLVVVCVAVDPAATSGPDADDTGIIAVGLGVDGEGYVLSDRTCHLDPDGWGTRAIRTLKAVKGDYIVGEVNNGGEMVEYVIHSLNARVPFTAVRASRGKATRAQPVSALYGDPRQAKKKGKVRRPPKVHHVGTFPELEDQQTTWVPGDEDSPDRVDALVWGLTELMVAEDDTADIAEEYEPVRIGANL